MIILDVCHGETGSDPPEKHMAWVCEPLKAVFGKRFSDNLSVVNLQRVVTVGTCGRLLLSNF
jgi:hypothetical protein